MLNMDDFPPETGSKVVANVRGKGGQKKAGAFNLVHIDESAIKGSALIEKHTPVAERPGYSNVDVSEDENLSTGKHTPVVDGPGYYNVDFPEGKNLSTGKHTSVADGPGYYNIEFPEGENLSTSKHTPVVDGPGYYNIELIGEDIEAENQPDQGGELFEMDDFPPEAGYEVVANVRGKGGQKKAGAFNLVHIDESSVKGSAQVERPPHLYTVVPDDVKGGGGGRRTKMVAIPMRKPNLYEAISENVEEGGGKGGGRGGKPKRIATPTGAVEAGKSPKSPRKRAGNFPQLKPKDKPPPAPPANRKPKPAEPVPNSGHQLHSTSLPEAPLVDPYVGKRITVAYREGDEPGESGGDGQPQFLFPSSHCQKFLAVR